MRSQSDARPKGGRIPRRAAIAVLGLLLVFLGSVGGARASDEQPILHAPVTLSVQDVDVKEVLAMLSRSRDINIVCEGDVGGPVSVDLHAVPFEEALRAIVVMAGFDVVHKGSIYYVHSAGDSDPTVGIGRSMRTFRLEYAGSDEIKTILEEYISPIGKVTSYGPLRSVVVEDLPHVIDRLEQVIQSLDLPPRQVLIEAQILEAHLANDVTVGIDWSLIFSREGGNGRLLDQGFANHPDAGLEGMFLTWGKGDFTSVVEALESVDNLNTLASPRVMAIDGLAAMIQIGGQLGFTVRTIVDNTVIESVQFLDTGAQLQITPIITSDGFVQMRIHPELSDGVIQEGLPSKTTTQVTSNVLVRDGETIFIGGLIREREETLRKGIPGLMNIPILGGLFGRSELNVQKSEIIVLITPHILEPGEAYPFDPVHIAERDLNRLRLRPEDEEQAAPAAREEEGSGAGAAVEEEDLEFDLND